MQMHDALAPKDRCAVCGKPADALTASRRCASCRRAEIQRNTAQVAAHKRERTKARTA